MTTISHGIPNDKYLKCCFSTRGETEVLIKCATTRSKKEESSRISLTEKKEEALKEQKEKTLKEQKEEALKEKKEEALNQKIEEALKEQKEEALKEEKEEEADFSGKEAMTAPPVCSGMLFSMPPMPPMLPTLPLPKMVIVKSSEQKRTVLGKKIESIDETPEIRQEEREDDPVKQEELKKETKATFGNEAKKNLKHFTFAKEDMEFKPPKKPSGSKGGKRPTASTFLAKKTVYLDLAFALFVILFLATLIFQSVQCLLHINHHQSVD